MVEQLSSIGEVRRVVAEAKRLGKTVGFVPTMGALHEGHLSLVREADRRSDVVVVSIFVNPTQFGPGEDFDAYPRDIRQDIELLAAEGVDLVFTPSVAEMYPQGAETTIDPGPLAQQWCGAGRPGHFAGVATVVAKLFNIVASDLAFFGEKDYQQLKVIEALARDMSYPVKVVGCPIVRERDGLAMSSRNAYLSAEERSAARAIFAGLAAASDAFASGERGGTVLSGLVEEAVSAESLMSLEYAAVVDSDTLLRLDEVDAGARVLVAASVGRARLIDNIALR